MATANPTPITPPRVPLLDERTGLISREWYLFFLSLFSTAQGAVNSDGFGPSAGSLVASLEQALEQLRQAALTQPNTSAQLEQTLDQLRQATLTQPLVSYTKEIDDLRQEVRLLPRPELGTLAALQQSNVPWLTFDTTPNETPTAVGTVAWDGGTTLNIQMTPDVIGRVNETEYYYIKASSAITKGQVVMFTGAVGSSGVPTGAPATGVTDGNYIMGIAAESLALNDFGLVQTVGVLRGLDTSAFLDGDILWYDPAVTGGLTKTKPTAPNVKVQMAAVITAGSGGSGSILIRVSPGSELGGTDSNVQFGTLANGDMIQYDGTAQYWQNRAVLADSILYTASTKALSTSSSFKYDGTNMSVGGALNASYRLNVVGGGVSWGNDTTVRGVATYDVSNVYMGSFTNTPVVFNVNNTERLKLDTSGNFIVSGTAQRLQADFSNATHNSRLLLQSSTTNGNTLVGIVPNGTATTAAYNVYNAANPTNSSVGQLAVNGTTDVRLTAGAIGTGTQLPLTMFVNGSNRLQIGTDGNIGLGGGGAAASVKCQILGTLPTSGTASYGHFISATIPSGSTGAYYGFYSYPATQAASFTCGSVIHFIASAQANGAGSTVTNQYGFFADAGLTGATNNFGFFGNIASGTNRYNLYMGGTADNYFNGRLGIGDLSSTTKLYVKGEGATSGTFACYAVNSSNTLLFHVRNDGLISTGTAANSPYNYTTASGANMYVAVDGVLYRSTSSLRYKTDVQDATHGLADVLKLRSVTYKGKNDGARQFGGLIAEEVHDAGLTEFVVYDEQDRPDALHYGNMVGLLAKAIQQQQELIDKLTARVAQLEAR